MAIFNGKSPNGNERPAGESVHPLGSNTFCPAIYLPGFCAEDIADKSNEAIRKEINNRIRICINENQFKLL